MTPLHQCLVDVIRQRYQAHRRVDLPKACDELGLPPAPDDPALTKAEYIDSRLRLLVGDVREIARRFLKETPVSSEFAGSFELEELLWRSEPAPSIPHRYRRDVARALGYISDVVRADGFLRILSRIWILERPIDGLMHLLKGRSSSLRSEIEQHMFRNPGDWSIEVLFDQLGALGVSDRRFAFLLEVLVYGEVCPEESEQRRVVKIMNQALAPCGVCLQETGALNGYVVFQLQDMTRGAAGRPKNLIFASRTKPDLRFRDAVNNDLEILSSEEDVLIYDRAIPAKGLRWSDLQTWWAETKGIAADEAKSSLYRRLLHCLPETSPPQRLLFETFFSTFRKAVPSLPALLPEVWLHYDPRTVRERGSDALLRQRMDFLMLVSPQIRIVIEVDGKQHYADEKGRADTGRYADMVEADRDLRLLGYEVYRFGAAQLVGESGRVAVAEFFERLFHVHEVQVAKRD